MTCGRTKYIQENTHKKRTTTGNRKSQKRYNNKSGNISPLLITDDLGGQNIFKKVCDKRRINEVASIKKRCSLAIMSGDTILQVVCVPSTRADKCIRHNVGFSLLASVIWMGIEDNCDNRDGGGKI
ncbi:hypothetical protein JTE90_014557 [Oedothorax gibbosus]|uniref:Uncharacterized protein n=1 Tax=Oedothorax gibbosus TaxID=931172 RepID=A0AAV6UCZ7_9ARAC|nr:hypothetical protein JTE90_014557 [Oedothorax gibbosus]